MRATLRRLRDGDPKRTALPVIGGSRKSENLLPFPVISAAANGDTTAMCAILKHYEGYIAKLCTRTLKDDAGNTYSYVDEEMRNRLQVRLITRTLAFHVG